MTPELVLPTNMVDDLLLAGVIIFVLVGTAAAARWAINRARKR